MSAPPSQIQERPHASVAVGRHNPRTPIQVVPIHLGWLALWSQLILRVFTHGLPLKSTQNVGNEMLGIARDKRPYEQLRVILVANCVLPEDCNESADTLLAIPDKYRKKWRMKKVPKHEDIQKHRKDPTDKWRETDLQPGEFEKFKIL
jgi:hypothetical protein